MYLEQLKVGAARSYRNIDLASRVEGANAHGLVVILFEELQKALDAMVAAMKRRDFTQRAARQGRALSILQALDTSLDFEKGGELARDLSVIYRHARRIVMDGSRANDLARVERARSMITEIASAWEQIA